MFSSIYQTNEISIQLTANYPQLPALRFGQTGTLGQSHIIVLFITFSYIGFAYNLTILLQHEAHEDSPYLISILNRRLGRSRRWVGVRCQPSTQKCNFKANASSFLCCHCFRVTLSYEKNSSSSASRCRSPLHRRALSNKMYH